MLLGRDGWVTHVISMAHMGLTSLRYLKYHEELPAENYKKRHWYCCFELLT